MTNWRDELRRMHAAVDAGIAEPARFCPPDGAPVPCRVELMTPQPVFGLAEAQAVVEDAVLTVTRTMLPRAPRKGDRFELIEAPESFRVLASATIEDADGARYSVRVERERK